VTFIFSITINPLNISASSAIHWGLGYEKPGDIPKGNAPADYLATFNAYYYGTSQTGEKTLFLTFDAGYENGYTEKILDTLKEHSIPASFFLVGTYLRKNPDLIKRMIDEGHIIGNHTMSHANMSTKDAKDFSAELKRFEEEYKSIIGTEMKKYYRPPEGIFSEGNLAIAKDIGYKTILWSASYADWNNKKQPSKEHAFQKLLPRLHPGAILLLHSTSATSTDILPQFIAECHKMGYKFKSLDDL